MIYLGSSDDAVAIEVIAESVLAHVDFQRIGVVLHQSQYLAKGDRTASLKVDIDGARCSSSRSTPALITAVVLTCDVSGEQRSYRQV